MSPLLSLIVMAAVGIVAGVLASPLVAPLGERYWRKRELVYEIDSFSIPLLGDKLRAELEGNPVREVSLVEVGLFNVGSVAITPEMFAEDITIRLRPKGKPRLSRTTHVLDVKLFGKPVAGRQAKVADDMVTLAPCLINKREWVRFFMIASGDPDVELHVRIADATVKQREEPIYLSRVKVAMLILPLSLLSSLFAILAYFFFVGWGSSSIRTQDLIVAALAGSEFFVISWILTIGRKRIL